MDIKHIGVSIKVKKFLSITAPLFLWAALMITVSSVPGKKLPKVAIWNWDKLAHTFEYFIFSLLLFRYCYSGRHFAINVSIKVTAFIGMAYAILDELHQLLIPNRSCTWQDMIADIIGVGLGVYLAVQLYKRKKTDENTSY